MIGSLPYTDAEAACDVVSRYLKDFPAWPQLPRRSHLENMYIQFSEGFPGITVHNGKPIVQQNSHFHEELEQLYRDHDENNYAGYAVGKDHASGLHTLVNSGKSASMGLKGQCIGPVSWGLCVTDKEGRSILYNEDLGDALGKFLKMKASWQENLLRTVTRNAIIFIDEPYLSTLGSAFVAIPGDQVSCLLREVLGGLSCVKGVHCCGGTDWKLLLHLPMDILSFDTYNYADSLACYQTEVNDFIRRGGNIAWGIVPNNVESLGKETATSLLDRLGEAIAPYTRNGISFRQLLTSSLLTPSCGLDSLSYDAAQQTFEMLTGLSEMVKRKYTS